MKRNQKICSKCDRLISLSNYRKHVQICNGAKQVSKNPSPPTYDWTKLQDAYDKGLSYRDLHKKYGVTFNAISAAKARGDLQTRNAGDAQRLKIQLCGGQTPMSLEARKNASYRMSECNPGGKSDWYIVNNIKVQRTWERDFALWCNANNIIWERCKPLTYYIDNKRRNYTPDFYLPEYDLYIEIKGYWWGNDRAKMKEVIGQYPNKKIKIIENTNWKEALCLNKMKNKN